MGFIDPPTNLMREVKELKAELDKVYTRLEAGTLHVVWCNADHEKQVGCDGCSCPLGRVIKDLRYQLAEAKADLKYFQR
jgi:hypothetical protein